MLEIINDRLLLLSSKYGYKKIVSKLVKKDEIDTQTQDSNGLTPLMWACRKGYIDIVKVLLEANVEVNAQDYLGLSALTWTILGKTENTLAIVELMLKKNRYLDINIQDGGGYTPLMWAADLGHDDLVSLLINHKAEINIRDNFGYTALTWTIIGRSKNPAIIASKLLEKDAHVNIFDNNGFTPLMWAAEFGLTDVTTLLIEKKASVHLKDNNGYTALNWAIFGNSQSLIETVNVLLKSGADPKMVDVKGWSPLMYAANLRNNQLIDLLLSYSDHKN